MTDPEFYFDERNAGDYQLFGIRYLIRPVGRMPPIPARLITCAARYCLWSLHGSGYLHVGTIVGTLTANRSTVGVRSAGLLRSPLVREEAYLRLLFGSKATHLRLSRLSSGPPPGFVDAKRNDLQDGVATATLTMDRAGIAVLSTSFDPGWRVKVDGRPQAVFPVAPALAATDVPAGTHTVTFSYTGFSGYVALFTVSGLALILVGAIDLMRRANERGKPRLVNPRHTGNPRG
jgi:hypothetical protein